MYLNEILDLKGDCMEVIKRDGRVVDFDPTKIVVAVNKAFNEVDGEITPKANAKAKEIAKSIESLDRTLGVEEIQDLVEDKLMASNRKDVARAYVRYRYKRELVRDGNTTDQTIKELLEDDNEYWREENSNKDSKLVTTQRDYIAGITSTDITRRFLLPKDVVKAHDAGIIHFHDADYFAQKALHNCDLVNLEDMLQNGTVISNTKIDCPHSFSTACTIATQIIAQVASSQYGGQSVSLSHLSPFVDVSRQFIKSEVLEDIRQNNIHITSDAIDKIVEKRVLKEVEKGIQTIQYQVTTLMTTNGQAPFITVFMYLDEVPEGRERDDLALVIEETLKQRIQGVKNEQGVWITPAFPKLIYVLDEDNMTEDSKYWYLTKLAAECTARRMVPDYISAKVMKKLKGDIYTCMG